MSSLSKDPLELVQEIETNKQKLRQLVDKLEKLAEDVDNLMPKRIDYKSVYIATERVKAISSMYELILKYRSEITSQIKEQFNIIKSLDTGSNEDKLKELVAAIQTDQALELLKSLSSEHSGGTHEQ